MADYRQSCGPGCDYNGFNSHSPGCSYPADLIQAESERRLKRKIEEDRIKAPFKDMLTDDLFRAASDARLRLEEAVIAHREAQEEYRAVLNVIMDRGVYNEFRKHDRD